MVFFSEEGGKVSKPNESVDLAAKQDEGRQRAIALLRGLRETTDPDEIQRQKESWQQLQNDLAAAKPSGAREAAEEIGRAIGDQVLITESLVKKITAITERHCSPDVTEEAETKNSV